MRGCLQIGAMVVVDVCCTYLVLSSTRIVIRRVRRHVLQNTARLRQGYELSSLLLASGKTDFSGRTAIFT